jgi:hypothetical protein
MRGVRIPVGGNTRAAHKHSTLNLDLSMKENHPMTTNSNDPKNPNTNDLDTHKLTVAEIAKNRRSVERDMKALAATMENEDITSQETPNGRVQRVLNIYRNIKPMLTVLSTLGVVPATWRAAIVTFTQALDGLAVAGTAFKAGKDL